MVLSTWHSANAESNCTFYYYADNTNGQIRKYLKKDDVPNGMRYLESIIEHCDEPIITSIVVADKTRHYQKLAMPYTNYLKSAAVDKAVRTAALQTGIDPALLHSVIFVESRYDTNAVSNKGALGLMQLMPRTAINVGVDNPFNPDENILGGAHYLRQMLERYNFDLDKALAAYNAGPANVDKYNGIPPFSETQKYVQQVRYFYENVALKEYDTNTTPN